MSALATIGHKVIAFFVDDPFLATGIGATLLAAGFCRLLLSARPLLAGALLAGGCLLALALSVVRAQNRAPDHTP